MIRTRTVQRKHLYFLLPLLIAVFGCAVSAQAASKSELEGEGFTCGLVGAFPNITPITRCEKCTKNLVTGETQCIAYHCDDQGQNCHSALVTADPQEANLDYPLVALGDVNADGVGDIAVGDPTHGQVVVLSGAGDKVFATLKSANPRLLTSFGQWVAGVEDLNGDGVTDILVKESPEEQPSVFSALSGEKLKTPKSFALSSEGAAASSLPEMGRVAGDAVVGDLNKDGVADLAIVDPTQGQVLVFSGIDGSLVTMLAVPGLLDPVPTKGRSITKSALAFGSSCVEQTKYVQSGSWRTLATLWNAAAQGLFRLPTGAQIKVRRGVGWFGWDTQKQTLDGVNTKSLSVGKSYIPSRMQMKVSQSTYVTYTYCPVGP
jgi:hypothetical protein